MNHSFCYIRKNQKQVNFDGNVVGNNRPDIQFDKNNVHYNVEFDTKKSTLERHKTIVESNDPNSINKFYKINK